MKQLKQYLLEILGVEIQPQPITKEQIGDLPMYIGENYKLLEVVLINQLLLLVEPRPMEFFSILQTETHFEMLKNKFNRKVVLILPEITAINRKRLIAKGINFIVPFKQLYLPDLLLDLRENFLGKRFKRKNETLLPSAQFLFIYHIIHRYADWKLEGHSFKDIAEKTGYTAMGITKAIENLKYHELIDVTGEKEKYIRFRSERVELWHDAKQGNLLTTPVLKRVYVDEKPSVQFMLLCNASALPEYSNMNPGSQWYYAIGKSDFYKLQKENTLINPNEYEGKYCLEVWKYNPLTLVGELSNEMPVVDPLSLYLSLKDSPDERIEMALEQIIEKYTW